MLKGILQEYRNIGIYLEAEVPKGILQEYRNIGIYFKAGSTKRDIAGI